MMPPASRMQPREQAESLQCGHGLCFMASCGLWEEEDRERDFL